MRCVLYRDVTVCILDRPRHADLIRQCREAGARIRLIGDGDVAGEHMPAHAICADVTLQDAAQASRLSILVSWPAHDKLR